jgi:hypothetical protein
MRDSTRAGGNLMTDTAASERIAELRAAGVKPQGYNLVPIGAGKRVTIVSDPELNLKE